jgi:hypothetical protein
MVYGDYHHQCYCFDVKKVIIVDPRSSDDDNSVTTTFLIRWVGSPGDDVRVGWGQCRIRDTSLLFTRWESITAFTFC